MANAYARDGVFRVDVEDCEGVGVDQTLGLRRECVVGRLTEADVTAGRHDPARVLLDDAHVSRKHATLRHTASDDGTAPAAVVVTHFGRNATVVQNADGTKHTLKHAGDSITVAASFQLLIGSSSLRIWLSPPTGSQATPAAAASAPAAPVGDADFLDVPVPKRSGKGSTSGAVGRSRRTVPSLDDVMTRDQVRLQQLIFGGETPVLSGEGKTGEDHEDGVDDMPVRASRGKGAPPPTALEAEAGTEALGAGAGAAASGSRRSSARLSGSHFVALGTKPPPFGRPPSVQARRKSQDLEDAARSAFRSAYGLP